MAKVVKHVNFKFMQLQNLIKMTKNKGRFVKSFKFLKVKLWCSEIFERSKLICNWYSISIKITELNIQYWSQMHGYRFKMTTIIAVLSLSRRKRNLKLNHYNQLNWRSMTEMIGWIVNVT